jgi:predicted alpha/beta hydrolase family esterase
MKFVIFHGSFGHPEENWIPELRDSLLALGQEVIVPTFPCDDWDEVCQAGPGTHAKYQSLNNWLDVFEKKVLPLINKDDKLCFVGHSIAPVFILHVVSRFKLQLDSAVFASPFMEDIGGEHWQFKVVNETFYVHNFNYEELHKLIPTSYVLYSDDDPYIDQKFFLDFGQKMNSSMIMVKRAGHLNASANLNEFPLILELCKSRLDLNLYQKYLGHRRELYGVDYIKNSEEIIYLKANEIFDEGIFKFRNLKKHGFCTLFTKTKFWDTQSLYLSECRKAAKRMKDLTRVFVVSDVSELSRPLLREQVNLDIKSDVRVYFVMESDINKVTDQPDFGVWDYEYLCTVDPNSNEATLSSRKQDIEKGRKWENLILKSASRIQNIDLDIDNFVLAH